MFTPTVAKRPLDEKSINSSEYFSQKRPVLKPAKKLAEVFDIASSSLTITSLGQNHKNHLILPSWSINNHLKKTGGDILLEYCEGLSRSARIKKASHESFEEIFSVNSLSQHQKKGKTYAKPDRKLKGSLERLYSLTTLVELSLLQRPLGSSIYRTTRADIASLNMKYNMADLVQTVNQENLTGGISNKIEAELQQADRRLASVCTSSRSQLSVPEKTAAISSLSVASLLADRQSSRAKFTATGWFGCFRELFVGTDSIQTELLLQESNLALSIQQTYSQWKFPLCSNFERGTSSLRLIGINEIQKGWNLEFLNFDSSCDHRREQTGHMLTPTGNRPLFELNGHELFLDDPVEQKIYIHHESEFQPQFFLESFIIPAIKSIKVDIELPKRLESFSQGCLSSKSSVKIAQQANDRSSILNQQPNVKFGSFGCQAQQPSQTNFNLHTSAKDQRNQQSQRSFVELESANPYPAINQRDVHQGLPGFLRQLNNRANNSTTQNHPMIAPVSQLNRQKYSQEFSQAESDDREGLERLASGFKITQYISHQKPVKPVESKLSKNITRELKPLGLRNAAGVMMFGGGQQNTAAQIRQNPYSRMIFCNTDLTSGLERCFTGLISTHRVVMQPSRKLQVLGLQLVVGGANLFVLPTSSTALGEQLIKWIPKARYLTGFESHQILAVLPESDRRSSPEEAHENLIAAVNSVQAIVVNTCRVLPPFSNLSVQYMRDATELGETIRDIILKEESAGRAGNSGLREFESSNSWGFALLD